MRNVLTFEETVREPDSCRIGGKAWGLAEISRAGFEVPNFCVLPTQVFTEHISSKCAESFAKAIFSESNNSGVATAGALACLSDAVRQSSLDLYLIEELAKKLDELGPGPYAVRSSMRREDTMAHSFAGQLETLLNQRTLAEVADSIVRCWASAYSEKVATYAGQARISIAERQMAVIVQQMVDSRVSGVLFSANPNNGDENETLISAAWGLGDGIVSGIVDADEFVVRNSAEVASRIAAKKEAVVRAPRGCGTLQKAVTGEDVGRRCLTTAEVLRLEWVGQRLARVFKHPVDVEWAFDDETLHVLQARPVTIRQRPAPDLTEPVTIWDDSNVQESFNGVTTPLTFSFACRVHEYGYRTFFRTLGTPARTLRRHERSFHRILGLLKGRVYYNLTTWYEGCEMLPSLQQTREDLEKMLGVEEPLDFIVPDISRWNVLRRAPQLAYMYARLAPRMLTADRRINKFTTRFDAVYDSIPREHLSSASISELMDYLSYLDDELLKKWDAPILNDFRVMKSSGKLRRIVASTSNDSQEAEELVSGLLSGIDGIESVEPTRHLIELARLARGETKLAELIRAETNPALLEKLRSSFPSFVKSVDEYVRLYGDRCMGELKLETVSLREDASFLFDILRNYLDSPAVDSTVPTSIETDQFKEARDRVRAALSHRSVKAFEKSVREARHAVKIRENLRLDRSRMYGLYRSIFRALGDRVSKSGVLTATDDIFYLTVEELWAYHLGKSVTTNLTDLVALRRREFAEYEKSYAPHRIKTRGSPYLPGQWHENQVDKDISYVETLKGIGCYPGVVEAPARVVQNPEAVAGLNGCILVANRTDPGWAPLFPSIRGLLIERGNTLSHSAVVARELQIPTIVAIPSLLRIIDDGEPLMMDGQSGTVWRIRRRGQDDRV
ncbi:PEP/pyruvate-binding domain-containing protein [Candidatus Mycobacterium methanotrophicum]|uniref:PEP-utilizing enzyme n=1 Tax=Candidatus Mycobacterium methanotrophicum TaxID=2943498 RepID=A0ABY4QK26_9MYCO|nr:PEP/pyruvate-binding domain-containing protein [Candidatus Mycobacterium methanotrophicum]UQX10164.1 PEP-utilizing enzyme [Candidatus Mycobacterium methanotrophicum]